MNVLSPSRHAFSVKSAAQSGIVALGRISHFRRVHAFKDSASTRLTITAGRVLLLMLLGLATTRADITVNPNTTKGSVGAAVYRFLGPSDVKTADCSDITNCHQTITAGYHDVFLFGAGGSICGVTTAENLYWTNDASATAVVDASLSLAGDTMSVVVSASGSTSNQSQQAENAAACGYSSYIGNSSASGGYAIGFTITNVSPYSLSGTLRAQSASFSVDNGGEAQATARLTGNGLDIEFRANQSGVSAPVVENVATNGMLPPGQYHFNVSAGGGAFWSNPSSAGGMAEIYLQIGTPPKVPVVIVPGIGGTYAKDQADDGVWTFERGIAPSGIQVDPLVHVYDDLIKTLENVGYVQDQDLFVVNYDWRLPPGPDDGNIDGVISGLTAASISDSTFEYAVDYLGETLRRVVDANPGVTNVHVICHSTGGLVTRTYIQSPAYGGVFDGLRSLPKVDQLMMIGVPNRGAPKAWNPLHDNWSADLAYTVVLSKIILRAYQGVLKGGQVVGPPQTITLASITDTNGVPDPVKFINLYCPTIRSLLATYDFLDTGSGFSNINSDTNQRNAVVLDLNDGLDLHPTADPSPFASQCKPTIIYGQSVTTPTSVTQFSGPTASSSKALANFTDFVAHDVQAGEVWFRDNPAPINGDGTVPLDSSIGQFVGDSRVALKPFSKGVNTASDASHLGLCFNRDVQRLILQTLGATFQESDISTNRHRRDDLLGDVASLWAGKFVVTGGALSVVLDPVDGFVVDGAGRRLGYSGPTGGLSEIPNSIWFGNQSGIGWIFGPVQEPLTLQLTGTGTNGNYYVMVSQQSATNFGGLVVTGYLAAAQSVTNAIPLTSRPLSNLGLSQTVLPAGTVVVRSNLTYTIAVTNQSPNLANNVEVQDVLPANTFFLSAVASQGSLGREGNTVTCALGNLASGTSATVTIEVRTLVGGVLTNTARVSDDFIVGVTNAMTVTVLGPPVITTQPSSRTNNPGTTATFSGVALGTAPLSYQWTKNGTNLSDSLNISGATTATLTLTNLALGDAANYVLVVTNLYGSATSSNATLTVNPPPSIMSQPQSQVAGGTAVFSVVVSGSGPLTFQWFKDGVPLTDGGRVTGATNATLIVTGALFSDAGNYSVVVSSPAGTVTSSFASLTVLSIVQQAYLKASNTGSGDYFGYCVALAGDTMVVGAPYESSDAIEINGDGGNNNASFSGAAYVFIRNGNAWTLQAYLKAANSEADDNFGSSVAISGDTVVVGAPYEDSNATGVNGDGSDNSTSTSGAAYIFVRDGTNWQQQAYLKAANTGSGDQFGFAVALTGDTVVVGAPYEDSTAAGVNGDGANNGAFNSGAAYVFLRSGTNWSQQAYLKASNTGAGDNFGAAVSISGETVVVGAYQEDSNATGVNGNGGNNSASASGAAYVFVRSGTNWNQEAYLKASNTGANDYFGWSVAVSEDTVVVGAYQEDSSATGVNGNQGDNTASASGAAYVFVRSGTNWSQQAYLKASNTGNGNSFGYSVAVSGDKALVGSPFENSDATGVNGVVGNNNTSAAGAAYLFTRNGTNWGQPNYLKASNTGQNDNFGWSVAVAGDSMAIGAEQEASNATGVNGDQGNNSASDSGAAYVFTTANLDPCSTLRPQLTIVSEGSTGVFITFNGTATCTYRLERATSVTGPWDTIHTQGAPASGLIEYHDTSRPPGRAFYRVARP